MTTLAVAKSLKKSGDTAIYGVAADLYRGSLEPLSLVRGI